MEKSVEKEAKVCFCRMTGGKKGDVDKDVESVERKWIEWIGCEVWIRKGERGAGKGKVVHVETKLSTGL